jgi:predicted alpha/beta superfamily hydrolase
MLRSWIAAFVVVSVICTVPGSAQQPKPKTKYPPGYTPGVDTITSFDKDHTVIGWLEIVPFESKILHEKRLLRVLVPANYFSPHNAHRSYPVLYMQDGQNLFDETTSPQGEWHMDETVEHLVGAFKIPPMFVVGIDNAGEGEKRSSEYLPYPDPLGDKARKENSVQGKEYTRFLLTEVMPFIEKRYRISRGPLNTGLGGSSYGADIALYTALEHPTVFGHVLIESPELWIGQDALLKDAEKAKLLPQKIYIGIGTAEAADGDPQRSTAMVNQVKDLEAILVKKGMAANHLRVQIEEGGQHNVGAWSRRLPDALLFLYGQ